MNAISDSKFAVWRCLVIMANIDGHFSDEEKKFLDNIHNNDILSDEQIKTLENDIRTQNTDFDSVYQYITEPRDRAYLINLARVLFHKDGRSCTIEKEVLDKINKDHKKTINLEEILESARQVSKEELKKHQIELDEADDIEGGGYFGLGNVFDYITDKLRDKGI
jgi:hypothetical protein